MVAELAKPRCGETEPRTLDTAQDFADAARIERRVGWQRKDLLVRERIGIVSADGYVPPDARGAVGPSAVPVTRADPEARVAGAIALRRCLHRPRERAQPGLITLRPGR